MYGKKILDQKTTTTIVTSIMYVALHVLFAIHPLRSDVYASYLPGVLVRARNMQHYLGPACRASL